ncbi:MAG TPA: hypothetical protein P5026_03355 [Kiritimatiellia bacterium]|nr:hypothetical protein [Kiritimatiellia bacterium]
MDYSEINRRHCLEVLDLHEGVDTEERDVTAQAQALRPSVTREEVSDALAWLRTMGFAERREKPLAGAVWRITKEGTAALRSL